jgi:conjugal transfer/type IV secretion protein DotA/TraY
LSAIPFPWRWIRWGTLELGWLLLVLEAVIAAPLWAMAHVNPEGDGAAGQAGQGYMLLLSLVLRPTLMIFGLFAAMLVSFVIMRIINVTFVTAVLNMQSESTSGIVTLIGVVIIFTGLSISAITKSFSLIYWIPDNVLRWVGGHVERLSDFGVEGETRHTYDAGTNTTTRLVYAASSVFGA